MLLWELLNAPPDHENGKAIAEASHRDGTRRLPFDKRCASTTKAGRRCRGRIRQGTEYCPFHDPEISAERKRRNAAKGGRTHHRLAHLPDGYLRKLTDRRSIGEAMDRLYREVRLGAVTPEMGNVLFGILSRLLDSGLCGGGTGEGRSSRRGRADRLRPKLAELLTRAERRAWRQAVANAPAAFVRTGRAERGSAQTDRPVAVDGRGQLALPAAS